MAFDDGEAPSDRTFEPKRVGLTVVTHTIQIQLARIRAERAGWIDWVAGDRMGQWEKDQGRPDAIVTSPLGERVAVEMELTLKTTKRYESILFDRLRQIRAKNFARVVWVAADADRQKRLETILKSISEFTREHAGKKQVVRIDQATHHPLLSFTNVASWPNF